MGGRMKDQFSIADPADPANQRRLNDLTGSLIGLSYKVANTLGRGFVEQVYQNALAVELRRLGSEVKVEWPVNVYYQNELVGAFRADLFVSDSLLVEVKACSQITNQHLAQCLNYLKASGLPICQVINFSPTGVQPRRVVNNF